MKTDIELNALVNRLVHEKYANFDKDLFRARGAQRHFNSLHNDADAQFVAVLLDLNTYSVGNAAYALPSENDGTDEVKVPHAGDKFAAMRRAITICAANWAVELFEEETVG